MSSDRQSRSALDAITPTLNACTVLRAMLRALMCTFGGAIVGLLLAAAAPPESRAADPTQLARDRMVDEQLVPRGIKDQAVLTAMRRVPRHAFVPESVRALAYADRPLPIGFEQTISQPAIVATMTELARVQPGSRVLEIGTGSGYQAAVLAAMGAEVYTIEIVPPLGQQAVKLLTQLGYKGVHARIGDGYRGWPEAAPFDAIIVTAAPPRVPEPLRQQLKKGGRLVIPVGGADQELRLITRSARGWDERSIIPVGFVPMTGRAQQR
jgi:protein-L-isoaspartate(D-aspartate) O-methyltransferase